MENPDLAKVLSSMTQVLDDQRKMLASLLKGSSVSITALPEFKEGDSMDLYIKRADHHFKAHAITDIDTKKDLFLSWIGSSVYTLLQNLCASDIDSKSYDELCQLLLKHYRKATPTIVARHKFWASRKNCSSYAEWVAELKGLALDCDFVCPNSQCSQSLVDENIRDMILRHTPHETIRRAVLAESNLTLDKLLSICTLFESTSAATETLTGKDHKHSKEELEVHQMSATYKKSSRFSSAHSRRSKSGDRTPNWYKSCPKCTVSHERKNCHYRDAQCRACGRTGHISSVCASKKQNNPKSTHVLRNIPGNFGNKPFVNELKGDKLEKDTFMVNVEINGKPMKFLVDTGASCSLVGLTGYKELGSPVLKSPSSCLKSYGQIKVPLKGWTTVEAKLGDRVRHLRLLVANTDSGSNIFGQTWFTAFGFKISQDSDLPSDVINAIEHVKTDTEIHHDKRIKALYNKFSDVFSADLGKATDFKASLHLRKNAIPRFHKPRQVPLAQKTAIKEELDRLVSKGILKPITTSDWAAPIVVRAKPQGKVRICGDFKVTINPHLCIDQYPIPRPEELHLKLRGGVRFSKLDMSDAYLQIELDENSKKLAVINTPFGLYEYQRLAFGIASAPALFQRYAETLLAGLDGCANYLDDFVITGTNEDEHFANLAEVLQRFKDRGLRCNFKKCEFFKEEVEYCGDIISANGTRPAETNIKAVQNLQRPKNLDELQSFLGKVNYYNKFINNFSSVAAPLNRLRRQNVPFRWTKECEDAFVQLKNAIISSPCLTHYDPDLPLILATDASSFGIGAVLSHRYPDGTEKPIAFASKTLTTPETRYSQIEKEALSIIFGVKKFHQYLYGVTRPFELQTDHKPLISIFAPDQKLPQCSIHRLQRWAITLMAYNYKIQWRSTDKHGNADALSRLPIGPDLEFDREESCHLISEINTVVEDFPVSTTKVAALTRKDAVLQRVSNYIIKGWPERLSRRNEALRPYFDKRLELSLHDGVIVWNADHARVIVPPELRMKVMKMLHSAHFGMVRMKQLARRYCYWPGINKDIEKAVKFCEACTQNQDNPPRNYESWPTALRPWERIHLDFAGPFMGKFWMIVVDAYSKFPYICPMTSITSQNTLKMLSKLFTIEGLPETLVTDNGPQLTSQEFQNFCNNLDIEHLTTAPFHPASNGEAERFVRTFKTSMKKICSTGEDSSRALDELLFAYRTTPNAAGKSPAELLHGRQPRTPLTVLQPRKRPELTVHPEGKFKIGDYVHFRNYGKGTPWVRGQIVKRLGKVMYLIDAPGGKHRRHMNQIRSSILKTQGPRRVEEDYEDFLLDKVLQEKINQAAPQVQVTSSIEDPPSAPITEPLRRSTRTIRRPVRFLQ